MLINFEKYENIESFFNLEYDTIFKEAYLYIEYIRGKAKKFCFGDEWQQEYLSSLFLVTYGLLKFEECNLNHAIYSLGTIASRLLSNI